MRKKGPVRTEAYPLAICFLFAQVERGGGDGDGGGGGGAEVRIKQVVPTTPRYNCLMLGATLTAEPNSADFLIRLVP
ncbi:hypothetical protein BDZ91DRAFT_731786 [Kalaharituber pfeilii]|nr:hypothetical protein BDZ91DRAFT_731786 [Kalaharituber pfeilii]